MPLPDYIDNDRHKLEAILKQLIQDDKQFHLDIATDFFRIEAWIKLKEPLDKLIYGYSSDSTPPYCNHFI